MRLSSMLHRSNLLTMKRLLAYAEKTGAIVTCEEHSIYGGLGSIVSSVTAQHYPVPVEKVGVQDTFGESGKPDELLKKYHLTTEEIVKKAHAAINRKK